MNQGYLRSEVSHQREVVAGLFFPMLRCEIFLFENNTTLIDVFEHFHDEKKSSKSSSFMLIFRLTGTLYICKLDGSY